jgi:hypothetical protein
VLYNFGARRMDDHSRVVRARETEYQVADGKESERCLEVNKSGS